MSLDQIGRIKDCTIRLGLQRHRYEEIEVDYLGGWLATVRREEESIGWRVVRHALADRHGIDVTRERDYFLVDAIMHLLWTRYGDFHDTLPGWDIEVRRPGGEVTKDSMSAATAEDAQYIYRLAYGDDSETGSVVRVVGEDDQGLTPWIPLLRE